MNNVRIPKHVVFRSFGSETVLLNLDSGQYHGLRGSGGRILELLAETSDFDAVARRVAEEYDHPLDKVERDMRKFVEALAARSLIELD